MDKIWLEFQESIDKLINYIVAGLPKFAFACTVMVVLYFFFKLIRDPVHKQFEFLVKDKLVSGFIFRFLTISKWGVLLIIFLTIMGKEQIITSILGAAGISAFVIGFAFKDLGENFLAGIMLAFKRPFRLGDTISSNGIEGVIRNIDLREIHLKTFDGKDVYIPNGQLLKNPLYNYTIDGFIRQNCDFHIDYLDDYDKARRIIIEECHKIGDILKEVKAPTATVTEANPPDVSIRCYYWIDTYSRQLSAFEIKSRLIRGVVDGFNDAGISSPNQSIKVLKD